MSERFLCGDGRFAVSLIVDDLSPLHLTGVHCYNAGSDIIDFVFSRGPVVFCATFDPDSDQVFNLATPIAVTVGTNWKGHASWTLPGFTDFYVRQYQGSRGAVPRDLSGPSFYFNLTSEAFYDSGFAPAALPVGASVSHLTAPSDI